VRNRRGEEKEGAGRQKRGNGGDSRWGSGGDEEKLLNHQLKLSRNVNQPAFIHQSVPSFLFPRELKRSEASRGEAGRQGRQASSSGFCPSVSVSLLTQVESEDGQEKKKARLHFRQTETRKDIHQSVTRIVSTEAEREKVARPHVYTASPIPSLVLPQRLSVMSSVTDRVQERKEKIEKNHQRDLISPSNLLFFFCFSSRETKEKLN